MSSSSNDDAFRVVGDDNGSAAARNVVERDLEDDDDDDDWEEWDGTSPYWAHCAAGSLAGVMEHAAVYPLDTVRTNIQVACAACAQINKNNNSGVGRTSSTTSKYLSPKDAALFRGSGGGVLPQQQPQATPAGMWQTIRHLVNEPAALAAANHADAAVGAVGGSSSAGKKYAGLLQQAEQSPANVFRGYTRLFRGIQTVLVGCVPAHALYFSSYEFVKAKTSDAITGRPSWWGSSLAGAAAVTCHDVVMTPLDTVKQRMQLGHYSSTDLSSTIRTIARSEGWTALYRSFPVTLASNVPYGMIMVATHETMKSALTERRRQQYQQPDGRYEDHYNYSFPSWQTVLISSSVAGFAASALTTPLDRIKTTLQTQALLPVCYLANNGGSGAGKAAAAATCKLVAHDSWKDAALWIWKNEGAAGFFRGLAPRVLSHTPAAAISWTTYETAKKYFLLLHHRYHDE